jgi:drug/metabolite transporter (DMT)-like permease
LLPGKQTGGATALGLILIVLAVIAFCIGTVSLARLRTPENPYVSAFYVMFFGSSLMAILGLLIGEGGELHVSTMSTDVWIATVYLALIGTFNVSLLIWLLNHAPVSVVATKDYMQPIVAVILGALLLSESVTLLTVVATIVIVCSVAAVVRFEYRAKGVAVQADDRSPPDEVQLEATRPS